MVLPPPNITVHNAHLGSKYHGYPPTLPNQKQPSIKPKTPRTDSRKPAYSSPVYKIWKRTGIIPPKSKNPRHTPSSFAPRRPVGAAQYVRPVALPKRKTAQSFRRLPAEIREMIWAPLMEYTHGKMPKIIRALRGDREMHFEICCLFYKQGYTFNLDQRKHWSFLWMGEMAIKSIRVLKIEIKEFRAKTRTKPAVMVPSMIQIERACKQLPNVDTVTLQCYLGGCHNVLLRSWDGYLSGLGNQLRKITIDFRFEPLYNTTRQLDLDRMLIRTYKNANKLFGVDGGKVFDPMRVGRRGRSNRRENNIYVVKLFWEMKEEGKTMEIKDKTKRLLG